jgi:nitrogen regulatory protein PII
MKLLTAIVQPHRLDAVRLALTEIGIAGMTVTEVRGYGRQKGHTEIYRGAEYTISFLPKLKVEVALPDDRVDDAISAITRAARTGKIGDGKIFVMDIVAAHRVRTGETGDNAL